MKIFQLALVFILIELVQGLKKHIHSLKFHSRNIKLFNEAWQNSIAIDSDLNTAAKLAVESAALNKEDANLAIFFVSSIYEASAFSYNIILEQLKKKLPKLKTVFGCTTGCPIGGSLPFSEPLEVEARASISVLLATLTEGDIDASLLYLTPEMIKDYVKKPSSDLAVTTTDSGIQIVKNKPLNESAIALIFATESTKSNLAAFLSKLDENENVQSFGAIASSVTSLHTPKVFMSSTAASADILDRYTTGLCGLILRGDITVQTVIARSCLPVGPMYEITKYDKNEVLEMKKFDKNGIQEELTDTSDGQLSPLVHLDNVLNQLPTEQSFSLKKELLVGVVPQSVNQILASGYTSMLESADFYGQKPTAFDSLSGSITLSSMPRMTTTLNKDLSENSNPHGPTFQFCIRDTNTARLDLQLATNCLQNNLVNIATNIAKNEDAKKSDESPFALLMLGSMERGNRVFRYQNWESRQLYQTLKESGFHSKVGVSGLYSFGSFTTKMTSITGGATLSSAAVMEADSVYALITRKSMIPNSVDGLVTSSNSNNVVNICNSDIITEKERALFNDDADGVIVTKRDPESANPVRVGTLDYFVPEKIPQPQNYLESIVWDREKDIDRMRERFQLTRALSQAKAAEGKFPRRDLLKSIKETNLKNKSNKPLLMIELLRASINNGKYKEDMDDTNEWHSYLTKVTQKCTALDPTTPTRIVSIGCNADTGTFKGQFEDLTILNEISPMPIFCNDFVVYVYQLLKAKTCGAHVVKLMASVLSVQDINYLNKIANSLGVLCVVVVSSKVQLMDVVTNVTGLKAISVTSRNMRIWKIDRGKANRILQDAEVKSLIESRKSSLIEEENRLIVFQEGFVEPNELIQAKMNGVDAVYLSEELVSPNKDLISILKEWI